MQMLSTRDELNILEIENVTKNCDAITMKRRKKIMYHMEEN